MLGVVVGPTRFVATKSKEVGFCFDILDLDAVAVSIRRIPLSFFGHGFAPRPTEPHVAALFEKKGPGGSLVDLREGVVLRDIPPLEGCAFYGHGAFSLDGSLLFAVETRLSTHAGLVSVRDGTSFAVLGELPTYGHDPHDLLLIDEGKTFAITNGGGPLGSTALPSVTFVDVASNRLLESVSPTNPRINAGHLALTARRGIALVSAPRSGLPEETSQGGVSLRSSESDRMATMSRPPPIVRRMLGESLSVAVHEPSSIALVTNPHGHLVTFWDLATKRLVKTWDIESPRGVTLTDDGAFFAVSCMEAGKLVLVSTETLEPVPNRDFGASRLSGSHIYLWQSDARRDPAAVATPLARAKAPREP